MASATIRTARVILPILGSLAGGNLYGWSGYAPAVRSTFDVGYSETSMIFSIALVSFTLGVLVGPAIFARLFPHHRFGAIAAAAALCLLLSGSSPTFGLFLLGYGVGFGFVSGALYNEAIALMSQTRRPALLVPASVAAFGLGGAVFGPASLWLTQIDFGLWSNMPALVCLVGVGLGGIALGQGAENDAETVEAARVLWPNRDIVRLWAIFAMGSLPGLIVLGMATELVPEGAEGVTLAGFAVLLAALGNTTGRLAAGAVATLYGPVRGIVVSLALSALSLGALILLPGPVAALVALLSVALAYGHLAANMPLLVRSRVSARDFPTSFGWVFTGWGFAGLVGPWSAGWLLDRTGDFTVALSVCAVLAVIALWVVRRSFPNEGSTLRGSGSF